MTVDRESRRYLLAQDTEQERRVIEQRYFEDADAGDRIASAEDALIDDYLDDRLDAADRDAFERHYLASAEHRVRLATVRRLSATANAARLRSRRRATAVLALAASILLASAAAVYFSTGRMPPHGSPVAVSTGESAAAPAARTFAITLSPVAARGEALAGPVVVPDRTAIIALTIQSDDPLPGAAQVVIATVDGAEAWRGPAVVLPSRAAARVEVPSERLPANDYIVRLSSGEREITRYALAIR